jgi:hypothetical protein
MLIYNTYIIIRRHGDSSILACFTRKLVAYSKEVKVELGHIKVIALEIYSRKPYI